MTNTPDEPLSDDQMSTEQGGASHGDVDLTGSAPQEGLGGGTDADGTDADGSDGDSTDVTDGDSGDADGTDA